MRGGSLHGVLLPVLVVLALALPLASAQPWPICGSNGNYTANSTYQANLKQLADELRKNVSSSLFAAGAVGSVPDAVYALAICRGDANASACADCVGTIFQDAQQLCAYDKEVSIVYDTCYLRFSNVNFLSSTDNSGLVNLYNGQNVTGEDIARYDRAVTGLLNATAGYAADNSSRRFATGELAGFSEQYPKIYAMEQCRPDLEAGPGAGAVPAVPRRPGGAAVADVRSEHQGRQERRRAVQH
uniref:Gnk2-homologous domain-containing protein n=1 Tax=Oryza brachyantha TaxID=4533 RepID=J3MLP6_ORYBR